MWQSHNEYINILLVNNMKKHYAYDWTTVNTSYTGPAPWLTWWTGCSGTGRSCPALSNCHLYTPAVSSPHHHVICCRGTSWNNTPGDMSVFTDHAFAPSWASNSKTAHQRKKSSRQTDRLPSTQCPLFQVQLHWAGHTARMEDVHAQSTLPGWKTCMPKAHCQEGRHACPKHTARREDVHAQSTLQGGKTCMPKACCQEGRRACPKHVARREDVHAQSTLPGGKTCMPKARCKEGRCACPKHVARREDVHAQSMLQGGKMCMPKACCKEGRCACPKQSSSVNSTEESAAKKGQASMVPSEPITKTSRRDSLKGRQRDLRLRQLVS